MSAYAGMSAYDYTRARKARDLALFELEVDFEPSIFSVRDCEAHAPEVRDWTEPTERPV